ncbi:MAG TPA: DUF3618 domain-containing protein [Bryobacteraceae bacterium]|nr:DUF3618 domain-containing protein [Bryobacteraceae bacterium]
MGEESDQIDQIAREIERSRAELGHDVQELEQKVNAITDWRHHFRRKPIPIIAAAFAIGMLLAFVWDGRK